MQRLFNRTLNLTAFTFLPAGLLAMSIPVEPANARNMYDVCLGQLTNVGVERQKAATACAEAIIPKELSRCVTRVTLSVSVLADDAIRNCFQSRRPVDVANCVVDINNEVSLNQAWPKTNRVEETFGTSEPNPDLVVSSELQPPLVALESCRRSLRPGVYSQCVTGLSRGNDLERLRQAFNTCLSAEDFPSALFPASPQN